MFSKNFGASCVVVLSFFVAIFASSELLKNWRMSSSRAGVQPRKLVMGTMSGWPPYVTINKSGDYEGFDIDIAKEIARRLNRELVIEDMDTAALIVALAARRVDFIMTGLDITPARQEQMIMIPYQEPIEEYLLLFWQKAPQGVTSLEDAAREKLVVCVEPGSSQEEIASEVEGITLSMVDPLLAPLELKAGRANAIFAGPTLWPDLKRCYPELVRVDIKLKQSLPGCGIGISKIDEAFAQEVSGIVDDLRQSGFLQAAQEGWFEAKEEFEAERELGAEREDRGDQ